MLKKLPFVISVIVFTATLITNLVLFRVSTGCVDIIGDGYAMGTDSEPVVIAQSCGHWQLATDADDFTTHTLLSVAVALVLGIITWGVVWIASLKNINVLKKLGVTFFMLALAVIGLIATSAIAAIFSGGIIHLDQTKGMLTALLCLTLSLIGSLTLIHIILKHKFNTKSTNTVH